VLHQIGVGVLGPVYPAYQPDPGRLVAVKQFRLDLPPESAHRFVAALERLIAADLTHLGIAAPLAAGLVENSPYLAMDFAAAESFDVVVRDYGPAPVAEALRVATQLGGALDFAAAVGVFHGSLHPRDVLISTDDTRVTGLGIAQALQELGVLPPIRRPYTAPERVAGLSWDRRADAFSLAALVYEMLFGRRIAGLGGDAADAIPSTDGLNVHVMRDLFARALAEDPAERFDTALAFADALHSAAAEPPAAVPRTRGARGRRKTASDPAAAARTRPAATPPLPLDSEPAPGLELNRDDELEAEAQEAVDRAIAASIDAAPPVDVDTAVEPAASVEPVGDAASTADVELAAAEVDRFALADDGLSASPEIMAAEAAESTAPSTAPTPASALFLDAGENTRADTVEDLPVRTTGGTHDRFADVGQVAGEDLPRADRPGARRRTDVNVPAAPVAPPPNTPPSFSSVALEESRSAIWPLALALVVGLLVGFAFGYGAGTRDRGGSPADVIASNSTGASPDADRSASDGSAAARRDPAESSGAGASSAQGAAPPAPSSAAAPSGRGAAPPASASSGPANAARGSSATRAERPRESASSRSAADSPRPAAESGRLLVRSTPAGARVSIDGREAGVTPATVNDLAMGAHVVRIEHQGYVTAERRVRIRSAQPAQSIQVELAATRPARASVPAPAASDPRRGSLMVDSRPSGARVLVDGRLVGTTPLLLDAVEAGDHIVRLEMDGFSTWSTTMRVMGGERNRVSGSLEQQ
jgi:serine/threonine-protein kinase